MHEPFASLDDQTRLLLSDKMLQIQHELSQTTLLITHNITEAVHPSDRILVMAFRRGRVKHDIEIDLRAPARRRLQLHRIRPLCGRDLERSPGRGCGQNTGERDGRSRR
jgi:ABC-type nitrate/sulfonate/bicarbonate transport system ATPase subunit